MLKRFYKRVVFMLVMSLLVAIPAAIASGQLLRNQLFGVSNHDVATLVSVVFVIAAVAFAASFLPVRRAASVDPMKALRYE